MFYVLVFEWTEKPLKSILCIPDTYPIIKVTFIIQAVNQWASSGSFRVRDDSRRLWGGGKLIETRSLFRISYGIFSFLSCLDFSLQRDYEMNLIPLSGRCRAAVLYRMSRGCFELCFRATLKSYPCEDDLFPGKYVSARWSDSLSWHVGRPEGVRLWHSWQGRKKFEHFGLRVHGGEGS